MFVQYEPKKKEYEVLQPKSLLIIMILRDVSEAASHIVAGVLVVHFALLGVIGEFGPVAPLIRVPEAFRQQRVALQRESKSGQIREMREKLK